MSEAPAITYDETPPPDDLTPQLTEPREPKEKPEEAPEPEKLAKPGEPAEPDKPKAPQFTPEQQAVFDDVIGKKVAKQREAEREAEQERQRRVELEQRLAQLEAPVRPNIPPVPDRYSYGSDQEFAQAVMARDALIAQAVRYDNNQAYAQQQREQMEQENQRKQQQELLETAQSYTKKAEILGITPEELQTAGAVLVQYGVPDHITHRILKDDRGPEMTAYLGKNIAELDMISRMEPMDAAVYLETVVKPKAKRAPPAVVPPPADSPGGAGMPEGNKGPKGVRYE